MPNGLTRFLVCFLVLSGFTSYQALQEPMKTQCLTQDVSFYFDAMERIITGDKDRQIIADEETSRQAREKAYADHVKDNAELRVRPLVERY